MVKKGMLESFNKSEVGRQIINGTFFPPLRYLPGSNILLPHVIVGDEAFRLDKKVVQDDEKKIFNYHLCRARKVTENAFGIMYAIFRIFFTPINVKPDTVGLIIWVCCCLHNYLRDKSVNRHPLIDEAEDIYILPTDNMIPLAWVGGFAKSEGFRVRSRFMDYFKNYKRN
ncbi:hypothetical protein NQ314_003754 [Rhamnusium bicolor]|uniref:DDE Tnp4 domain-containing protein n=1 Tax=Rhamnusium bicolor TaxID=1586634 RepID=A0AAV8ZPF3_9CUCU|nr:hypothetical protein NQ314_003754 [Rhamnusium bicolor]